MGLIFGLVPTKETLIIRFRALITDEPAGVAIDENEFEHRCMYVPINP